MNRLLAFITIFCSGCASFLPDLGQDPNVTVIAGTKYQRPQKYEPLRIHGAPMNTGDSYGTFDPSVEFPGEEGVGWMSYSVVEVPRYVHTCIARTTDRGKTWSHVSLVNKSREDTITYKGKPLSGVWRNEVSSLVYDPADKGREWKIYWHKYFAKSPYKENDRLFDVGWIACRYASDPAGPWSEEEVLFGAGNFPAAPFKAAINLNSLDPALKDFVAYTEIGAFCKNDILYMSLAAVKVELFINVRISTIIIASRDHGRTWKYIGTVLTPDDASRLGYRVLDGSSIASVGSRVFLLVSPRKDFNQGTCIFEFETLSPDLAYLRRGKDGKPALFKYIPLSVGARAGGQSDYDEHNEGGGLIIPQWDQNSKEFFKIYNTGEHLIR